MKEVTNKVTNPNITESLPHRYLVFIGMLWVCFLYLNIITAFKTFEVFGFLFSVAMIMYPVTYIFSDIFTEVYGYRVSRKVVWGGFICLSLVALSGYVYSYLPADPSFNDDYSFNLIFRAVPMVTLSAIVAFFVGEISNSYILAKLKIKSNGNFESFRYVTSTFFGQMIDNFIFGFSLYYFVGWFSFEQVPKLVLTATIFCTLWEIFALPITKRVIRWIKEKEGIDTYDHGTNFNPFKLG